jgi:hypothetical protein
LPAKLVGPLRDHLVQVRVLHEQDLDAGFGETYLPYALAKKYEGAGKGWGWQYVFPSEKLSVDPRSGSRAVIISMKKPFNVRSRNRRMPRALSNPQAPTRCATASRRICCNPATTFVLCKSY